MEKIFTTLYKPDARGATREWTISVDGNAVTITHGMTGGKLRSKTDLVAGKNIGKSNETSPEEQALRVAEAKWKHQKDQKGYGETVEEATVAKKAMLALDFNEAGHRIKFPCMVQPKLDGVRCLAHKPEEGTVTLTSRNGNLFAADLSHITKKLDQMLQPGATLDGELYLHGEELEDISSATKKDGELTSRLQFWVFDIVYPGMPNSQRAFILENTFVPSPPVVLTKTYTVKSMDDIERFHQRCCDLGFEGVMIRNYNGQYRYGYRSGDLQKYKVMLDQEYPILHCFPDKDGNAMFTVGSAEGEFDCCLVGSKEGNRKYLEDRSLWEGKKMTVQYQKKFVKTGLPQFPVGKAVRDYE